MVCLRPAGRTWCLALFLALGIGLLPLGPAQAQLEEDSWPSAQQQDAAYRELAREVDLLARQLGLVKKVVQLAKPAVVHIEAAKTSKLAMGYGARSVEEAGSGVVIEWGGKHYVLTNRHVIKQAEHQNIKIKLADGREIRPVKVWSDRETDIAVMEVAGPRLIAARIGNSDAMEIGDFVIAVGSPFGLSHSVTYGIISAKGRRDLELGDEGVRLQDFMQTDAAINPGNSGGPLLNLKGELIGINTAIASNSGGNEGIGFTIPVNMVMVVAKQLIHRGTVVRAFLGVNLDSKFSPTVAASMGLPRPKGARVTGITPSSPAATADLQVGDVILSFDGISVEDDNHLVNLVGLTEVGKDVPLVILRDRKPVRVNVQVRDRAEYDKSVSK